MLVSFLRFLVGVKVLMVLLALSLLVTKPDARRYGDTLQIALPLLGWACAGSKAEGTEFFLRYAVMFFSAHGAKRALEGEPVNQRPNGRDRGFPSAHTSTAVLGASQLVHTCLRATPVGQAVVVMAAGFVGASRIEAGAHDIWQVLAGAILGYGCDRALRRPTRARARVVAACGQARTWLGTAWRLAVQLARRIQGMGGGALPVLVIAGAMLAVLVTVGTARTQASAGEPGLTQASSGPASEG